MAGGSRDDLGILIQLVAVTGPSSIYAATVADLPTAPESVVVDATVRFTRAAAELYQSVRYAKALERIPGPKTERHFAAALARWHGASDTLASAACDRDLPELSRCGRALNAGSDEILRMAAPFRHATNLDGPMG